MLSNCGFDFLCCMLGGFELFITSVWVQLHAGRFSASRASRGSCTQFLCCTLGGFELFITSVGVQLHAGRFSASRASRGSCTQFLCCTLGGSELFITSITYSICWLFVVWIKEGKLTGFEKIITSSRIHVLDQLWFG